MGAVDEMVGYFLIKTICKVSSFVILDAQDNTVVIFGLKGVHSL